MSNAERDLWRRRKGRTCQLINVPGRTTAVITGTNVGPLRGEVRLTVRYPDGGYGIVKTWDVLSVSETRT